MQRTFNWVVVLFLCFLTGEFLRTKNDVSEVIHNRYKINCTLSERLQDFRNADTRLQDRLNVIESAHADKSALYEYLQDISVKVESSGGCGTGVLFCREVAGEQRVFVWTAGHVVDSLQRDDGSFKYATIKIESRCNGKFTNEIDIQAKVIAFSSPYGGEDLALLEIAGDCAMFSSAEFAGAEIQPVGTEIIHVGSVVGLEDSVSLGIISQTDRDHRGKMYDQTSCMAYPGSSGGGVWTTDGKCVGLITLGIGPGLNFFVPMRRIRAWAKEAGVEWAIDYSVPVPLTREPTRFEEDTWPSREPVLSAT